MMKGRNFDPESRTFRKRTTADDESMNDTVEKNVEGVAEMIIAEDEQRRNQDLVSEQ
jgi:coiled-coil domain-containing protein 12